MEEITHSWLDRPLKRDNEHLDSVLEALQVLHTLLEEPTAEDADEKNGNLGGRPQSFTDK